MFVNAELVRRGLARTLTIPPNDSLRRRSSPASSEPRGRAGRGLWGLPAESRRPEAAGRLVAWLQALLAHGYVPGGILPMAQMRMRQSMAQFELAFEQETALERRRREQLRKRAANRSRARRITRTE